MGVKVFIAAVAIGGGCIGAPLLLGKEGFFETSSQKLMPTKFPSSEAKTRDGTQVSKKLSTADRANVGSGNCEIQKMSDDSIDFLLGQERGGQLYVELLCEKDSSDSESVSGPHIGTGLFPEQLFAESFNLEIDKQFNLKIKTMSEEGKVNMQSSALRSSLMANYKDALQNRKGETVTSMEISGPTSQKLKIYMQSN